MEPRITYLKHSPATVVTGPDDYKIITQPGNVVQLPLRLQPTQPSNTKKNNDYNQQPEYVSQPMSYNRQYQNQNNNPVYVQQPASYNKPIYDQPINYSQPIYEQPGRYAQPASYQQTVYGIDDNNDGVIDRYVRQDQAPAYLFEQPQPAYTQAPQQQAYSDDPQPIFYTQATQIRPMETPRNPVYIQSPPRMAYAQPTYEPADNYVNNQQPRYSQPTYTQTQPNYQQTMG